MGEGRTFRPLTFLVAVGYNFAVPVGVTRGRHHRRCIPTRNGRHALEINCITLLSLLAIYFLYFFILFYFCFVLLIIFCATVSFTCLENGYNKNSSGPLYNSKHNKTISYQNTNRASQFGHISELKKIDFVFFLDICYLSNRFHG